MIADIRNYTELPGRDRRAILRMIGLRHNVGPMEMDERIEEFLPEIREEARAYRIIRGWFDFGEVEEEIESDVTIDYSSDTETEIRS